MKTPTALLCAGGTGGHLFPAMALAEELTNRGWTIHLATDERAKTYSGEFPAASINVVPSATFGDRSVTGLMRTGWRLFSGYLKARRLIGRLKPDVVVGFGGYPTVPPLLAAAHKGCPTIVHEQNAIIGRANSFLASRVNLIATGFELAKQKKPGDAHHIVTGNPLRDVAHEAAKIPFAMPREEDVFRLLVFGGSQGARFFSEVVPAALALLEPERVFRIRLVMQSRPEDSAGAVVAFDELGVSHSVSQFFPDMPEKIARAHLVVCRAGASSVSELALIGRPSVLVPLPGSLDDDQGANAAQLESAGGAILVRQKDLTPERLAEIIRNYMEKPQKLFEMAALAKKASVPDAAKRLADLVEKHA